MLQMHAQSSMREPLAGEVISQVELSRRMKADYAAMRHTYIMTYIRCAAKLQLTCAHPPCSSRDSFPSQSDRRKRTRHAEGCCWTRP